MLALRAFVYLLTRNVSKGECLKTDVADKTPLSLPQGFTGLCACPKFLVISTCAKAVKPLAQGQGRAFVGDVKTDVSLKAIGAGVATTTLANASG